MIMKKAKYKVVLQFNLKYVFEKAMHKIGDVVQWQSAHLSYSWPWVQSPEPQGKRMQCIGKKCKKETQLLPPISMDATFADSTNHRSKYSGKKLD
jgi:hypothetical protein